MDLWITTCQTMTVTCFFQKVCLPYCYQKLIQHIPPPNDFKVKCYSTVTAKSTRNNIALPFNVHLGELRIATPHDQYEFEEAANYTTKQLAD